jgi:trigger factor
MELVQNKEGLVATLTVKVSQEDYADKVEKELRRIRQTSQIKGFRPGNAPMSLIKKMYGTPLMVEEINKLILESIKNYEQENAGHIFAQVIPSEQNQILTSFGEQKDFEFVYEAGFYPEFTYKIDENTELPYYNIILGEEEIDEEIAGYCNIYGTDEDVEAIDDDCLVGANINLVKDGEEITQNANFLMSVIPDEYKHAFLDKKVDETVEVEIRKVFTSEVDLKSMLEVNNDEFNLLPETLAFTVTKITKIVPAPIDQELFDKIAGEDNIHSEEELREYARDVIRRDYDALSLDKLYKDSIEILPEKANVNMPEDFIKKYLRFMQKDDNKISDENLELRAKFFAHEIKWKYIMSSLLTQNEVQITYDTLREEIRALLIENHFNHSDYYSDEEIDGWLNVYIQNKEYMKSLIDRIKGKQFASLLKEKAKLNIKDVTYVDFKNTYYKNKAVNTENNNEEIQS